MSQIHGFKIDVHGTKEELKQVEEWLNSLIEDGHLTVNNPWKAWADIFSCQYDHDVLRIEGVASSPGHCIAQMITTQFPVRAVTSSCDSEGVRNTWEYKGHNVRLLEMASPFLFDELGIGYDDWEVRGGYRLSREDRIQCIRDQLYKHLEEGELKNISGRSTEEWDQYIEERLYDVLPTICNEEDIQKIPVAPANHEFEIIQSKV